MEQRKINNYSILAILKLYIYQQGIYVPNELSEELKGNEYFGYRTTSGIFMKLGGTLSIQEFESLKQSGMLGHLVGTDYETLTYEEYLQHREYATASVKPFNPEEGLDPELASKTFFVLEVDEKGKFKVVGQYVDEDRIIYPVELDDVGVFLQEKYDDKEAVAIQAGGIRARVAIGGKNCASGCSFCSFSNEAAQYKNGTYTDEKLYSYLAPLIYDVVVEHGISNLFITGGNPNLNDMENWTRYLEESIRIFKMALEVKGIDPKEATIDAMITPRTFTKYVGTREEYREYLLHLKELGITSISPNMEIWSQENLDKYCPSNEYTKGTSKSDIGHDGYIDFISEAVDVFGRFNVRSALIVGLESIEETKTAIRELVSLGCYVTLSPFMPPECARYGTKLPTTSPSPEIMLYLNKFLEDTVEEYLSTLSPEEREEAERNISSSLNAHNRHNTGNINGSHTPLDHKECEVLANGYDPEIATTIEQVRTASKQNR